MDTTATPTSPAAQRLERLLGYLETDPGNEPLRADIFQVALQLGRADLARAQVTHQLERNPLDVNWRHREAALAMQRHDYADAVRLLSALAPEAPDNPWLRCDLARALFRQGQFELAQAQLEPLVASHLAQVPSAMALWLRCGQRLVDPEHLLDTFQARAADVPLPAEAYGVASVLAIDAERIADARAWSAHALALAPAQREALVTAGTLALADGDVAQATAYLDACLAEHPQDGRALSALGMARLQDGDAAGARAVLKDAVLQLPEHIGTWHALGWSQLALGEFAAARDTFAHALDMDRNFGESHGALAVALAALGEVTRAQEHIDRALRLDSRSLAALYAKSLLAGEGRGGEAFRLLARRILGRQKSLTGTPLADIVLSRLPEQKN